MPTTNVVTATGSASAKTTVPALPIPAKPDPCFFKLPSLPSLPSFNLNLKFKLPSIKLPSIPSISISLCKKSASIG